MTTVSKNGARRFKLAFWQKLLLILGSTLLCGLAAFVLCQFILTPTYTDAVKVTFDLGDRATAISLADEKYVTEHFDLFATLNERLANDVPSRRRGDKSAYYFEIADALKERGLAVTPRDLAHMVNVVPDTADAEGLTMQINVSGTTAHRDPDELQIIAEVAYEQFGAMIFGTLPEDDPREAHDLYYTELTYAPQVSAVTDEEGNESEIVTPRWTGSFILFEGVIDTLPNAADYYQKEFELRQDVEDHFDDAVYQQILTDAQVDGSAAQLRSFLRFPTSTSDTKLEIEARWPSGKDARSDADGQPLPPAPARIALAAAQQAARIVFPGKTAEEGFSIPGSGVASYLVDGNEAFTVTGPVTLEGRQNLREQPKTLLWVVIASMLGLIVSYAVFSRQPLFDTVIVIFFVIFTFICVFPFYYLFINTISDNELVASGQINFYPRGVHFTNYSRIMASGELPQAIFITVARTVLGTALMVLTSAWAGYLVTKQKMWKRSFWYRALVVTMYFNAGLIPWYTNMLMLGLTNNFLAYIIPGMVAPYNIILVKTYIESIPASLEESAIIDGASTTKVFMRIILPLSVPILATIAIFGAVGNWNSFQDSLLLMQKTPELQTLQHRLYTYLNQTTNMNTENVTEQAAQSMLNNGVTTKYTIAMITIIPILLVYPFMQRYFVKGIMLGAVKG